MGNLPLGLDLPQTQTQWSSQINPLLGNPLMRGSLVNNIKLLANTPQTISHGLSRNMQGWFVTDTNAGVVPFRTQPLNQQTLTLQASADCTINIWCY